MRTPDDIYDEWLVLRCQQGETAALSELVSRWQPRLRRHAMRTTGRGDEADEIVQATWLAVIPGLDRLQDPASLRPWIYRILNNKCADWIRTRTKHRQHECNLGLDPADRRTTAGACDDDNRNDLLRAALRQLDEDKRVVLQLHYLDRLSIAEIASILSLPLGTIKSRLHHARKQLRETFERKER